MSRNARQELITSIRPRYQKASRKEKQRILDELTLATGYHRKYATTLLNQNPPSKSQSVVPRGRPRQYGSEIEAVIIPIWEAAGRICSKRLVPFLPELIESMERHGHLELVPEIRERLLTISPATARRLLAPIRRAERVRGRSITRKRFAA